MSRLSPRTWPTFCHIHCNRKATKLTQLRCSLFHHKCWTAPNRPRKLTFLNPEKCRSPGQQILRFGQIRHFHCKMKRPEVSTPTTPGWGNGFHSAVQSPGDCHMAFSIGAFAQSSRVVKSTTLNTRRKRDVCPQTLTLFNMHRFIFVELGTGLWKLSLNKQLLWTPLQTLVPRKETTAGDIFLKLAKTSLSWSW